MRSSPVSSCSDNEISCIVPVRAHHSVMRRTARERSKVLRAVSAILVLSGIMIWSFFATIHERRGPIRAASTSSSFSSSNEGLEHLRLKLIELARGRRAFQDLSLHVVVRRRVPTGPDAIHNRRAGTYRQQPGA